jgi:hypothetical protein
VAGEPLFSDEDIQAMRRNRVSHYVKFLFSGREAITDEDGEVLV